MKYIIKYSEERLLFLTFLIISLLTIIISNYFFILIEDEKLSRGFYSDKALFFTANDVDYGDIIDTLKSNDKEYILIKELGLNYYIRGIYYDGNVDTPDLIEGRFFTTSDFFTDKNFAVVGSDVLPNNNTDFITLFGKEYKIIGIIGTGRPSQYDRMIFVNIDSLPKNAEGLWAIDSSSHTTSYLQYDTLLKAFDSHDLQIVKKDPKGILHLLKIESKNIGLMFIIALLFLFSSLYVTQSWFDKKKYEYMIVKLVGYRSEIYIYRKIINNYLTLAFGGYLCSLLMMLVLDFFGMYSIEIGLFNLVPVVFLMIIDIALISYPLTRFSKLNVTELLRGDI